MSSFLREMSESAPAIPAELDGFQVAPSADFPARPASRLASLSLVYPMFNEIENIETAVREGLRVGCQMADDFEVIVVDDASTDGCGALADEMALRDPRVRVIHHPTNRKLGGALRTGFAAARSEWILYIDSDLPIQMDDALGALPLTRRADAVIGWRKTRAESARREVISKGYNFLIRLLFGLRVRDVNFAFKLFRREHYAKMRLTSEGSFIDAELLIGLRRAGARVAEIGLDYYPRVAGVSTLASNRVILVILKEMLCYRLVGTTWLGRD